MGELAHVAMSYGKIDLGYGSSMFRSASKWPPAWWIGSWQAQIGSSSNFMVVGEVQVLGNFVDVMHDVVIFYIHVFCCCLSISKVVQLFLYVCYREIEPMLHAYFCNVGYAR
jgi:hypothetical protein